MYIRCGLEGKKQLYTNLGPTYLNVRVVGEVVVEPGKGEGGGVGAGGQEHHRGGHHSVLVQDLMSGKPNIRIDGRTVLCITLRLVTFNFFERKLKRNINFHFCYAQTL